MDSQVDFIHVGDYKTATTWFQKVAFRKNPEICYLDDPATNHEIVKLLYELVDYRDLDFNAVKIRERLVHQIQLLGINNQKLGISREVFSGTNPITLHDNLTIARRIKEVFGCPKIILLIREQFSMIESIYNTYIKTGGTLSFNNFVFDPIVSKGLIQRLKYDMTVRMYQNVFGEEKVFVGLFEEFKSNKKLFLKKLWYFLECENIEYIPDEISAYKNKSLTSCGVIVQRFLNRFIRNEYNSGSPIIPAGKLILPFLTKNTKKRLLNITNITVQPNLGHKDERERMLYAVDQKLTHVFRMFSEILSVGKKPSLPRRIKNVLKEEFKESNKKLAHDFKLPVDKYGWSL